MDPRRLLIVEDDVELVDCLKMNFQSKGFDVESAADGIEGLTLATENEYAAIILDVDLPGIDGLEICRRVRADNEIVPILMLTCQGSEIDRVVGLEMGADDYLAKPFSMHELIARVKALIRRLRAYEDVKQARTVENAINCGGLSIDIPLRRVVLDGNMLELTPLEFDFLVFLAANAGRPVTREELLSEVWKSKAAGYQQAVTSTAKRLRAKLGDDGESPKYLHTVRGVGYRFGPAAT